jgi:hypothetical protein
MGETESAFIDGTLLNKTSICFMVLPNSMCFSQSHKAQIRGVCN